MSEDFSPGGTGRIMPVAYLSLTRLPDRPGDTLVLVKVRRSAESTILFAPHEAHDVPSFENEYRGPGKDDIKGSVLVLF